MFEIRTGDCLEVLRGMADSSVDSIVTDPPYGLSFMGKKWDYDVPDVAVWAECLRVLKPGGHLLAFAGTRTQHRMACRIEDAGFEIRDMIAWVYGSGFPKSLDVSKAIDKANGRAFDDRYALGRHIRERRQAMGYTPAEVNAWFGYRDGCQHWERQDSSGARVPTLADWRVLHSRLALSDDFLPLVMRTEAEREVIAERRLGRFSFAPGQVEDRVQVEAHITAPATPAAQQWAGWGTALKPALEPITVARKPLVGTVAENVLQHGTGGINVDGCRVDASDGRPLIESKADASLHVFGNGLNGSRCAGTTTQGRWPANLIHDGSEEVVAEFPQSEASVGTYRREQRQDHGGVDFGVHRPAGHTVGFGDSGSAARFFYCAKASKRDRDEGLDKLPETSAGQRAGGRAEGSAGLVMAGGKANPYAGTSTPARNHHPTVKPTDLMRYLCRLVTPPGGLVLDPFAGSGSTGKGALLEGFRFLGIERDPEYAAIAKARCAAVEPQLPL